MPTYERAMRVIYQVWVAVATSGEHPAQTGASTMTKQSGTPDYGKKEDLARQISEAEDRRRYNERLWREQQQR